MGKKAKPRNPISGRIVRVEKALVITFDDGSTSTIKHEDLTEQ